ncbi:queuosine 5'-phosphate N-glycosylase/hydrolase-like [Montipora foliosa]|uniref:queuosine 5'-phosphate N-glycosylase/hydrolase-like n=1 Tax=Montipora foliosa TaxID=591990 RepID=UPI0035F146A6
MSTNSYHKRNAKPLYPRESAKLISSKSQDVSICIQGVKEASKVIFDCLKSKKYSFKIWKEHELHPKEMTESTVDWIAVLDTLNFSFWTEENVEPWTVRFEGKNYTGYWALCASINRALKEGIPFTTPSYYAGVTSKELQHIFRSETPTVMPLLEERATNLNEVGKILANDYKNSFTNVISECNGSAKKLLALITSIFKCFQDESDFDGTKVSFYKRAQILISDIWACFEGKAWGSFHDISFLTMFADYKVPQSLLHLSVLKYTNKLMEKLKRGEIIPPGDRLELEIRGNSIWGVELIYQELQKKSQNDLEFSSLSSGELDAILNSVIIDFYLWDFAKEKLEGITELPSHKTRTIFY